MKGHRKAKKYALKVARDSIAKATAIYDAALDRYVPRKRRYKVIRDAIFEFGVSGLNSIGNFSVRLIAVELLVELMLEHLARGRRDTALRYAFFTMTVDAGFCFESAPDVQLAKLQLSARRLLQRLGLQGVGCIDLVPLRDKLAGDSGRRIIVHIHGIVWTRDPGFKFKAAGKQLSKSRHYSNMLGAPSISFVTRREAAARVKAWERAAARRQGQKEAPFKDPRFRRLETMDQTPHSMAFLAQYILAPVTGMKHRYQGADGSIIVKSDPKALSDRTALRLAEITSLITPRQAIFGVGNEGGAIKRAFGKRIDAYERKQRKSGHYIDRQELEAAWKRLLRKTAGLGLLPSVIKYRDD